MAKQAVRFTNHDGEELQGAIYWPSGKPRAMALFAHCFTCTANVKAAVGIAVPVALVRIFDQETYGHYKQIGLVTATLLNLVTLGIPGTLYYFVPGNPRSSQNLMVRSVVLLTLLAGCHTMRFEVSAEPHDHVVYDRKSFYLWGLAPTKEVDVSRHCPDGVAAVREETRFSDGFFGVVTLGIWQPRSSWYYCLAGPRP